MSKTGNKIAAIRGMEDIFPPATSRWQQLESTARHVFALAGFQEIRTPLVEPADLFVRGVGQSTAIVEKEMYTFTDRSGDLLALRPEGTASVVRAYVAASVHVNEPISRYWYQGPMFRCERPQKGRQREFHQLGLELFGTTAPAADVEIMAITQALLESLGVRGTVLEVNSIGCESCRPVFHQKLVAFLQQHTAALCDDCRRRMEKNPLRVFDCKQVACREILCEAPLISASWCQDCRTHFGDVQAGLAAMNVSFVVNERIVRGLDYYMRTAFEWTSDQLGAQSAVAAGGRYDGLVASLGGADVPGVGVAVGVERLLLLIPEEPSSITPGARVFMAPLSAASVSAVLPVIQELRRRKVMVEWDYEPRSLKSQLRRADKLKVRTVVIVGDDELAKGVAIVRDMETKEQREVRLTELARSVT